MSVIVSCYFSYFTALVFGFTRGTLFGCFFVFLIPFAYILLKRKTNLDRDLKKNWKVILIGILIYAIYFIALYPAIFRFYNGYFVMGGPNWQDTAMHLSIIQSLTQGNFPPQAPYFSGQPLSYYYFSDFHAAIVNTLFGKFFPEILILLNPFLAMTFYFSVYALSYQLSKRRIFSVIAGIAAVFYGNLEFVNLIKATFTQGLNYFSLVARNPFNFDQNFMQMTPMADYFLQNRPMMVGLSIVVLVVLLLKSKKIFIAGILAAALIKFQLFGFLISWAFFASFILIKVIARKVSLGRGLRYFLLFGSSSLLAVVIFMFPSIGSRSAAQIALDSFIWTPWQKHSLTWFILFTIGNLNIGFLVLVLLTFLKRIWRDRENVWIFLGALFIFIIPFSMRFTIYEFDMLKFFYYLAPFICALLAYFCSQAKHKKLSVLMFIIITTFSSLTSANLLVHSYLNKNAGYSYSDYEAGIWIRGNTPQRSVFITMPTVHSATSDIGGRLRVISYINWPYSHGFNVGSDNVFSRVEDVTVVYKTGDANKVKLKYKAKYVFYGQEEKGQFPTADKLFGNNKNLKLVYNQDGIKIYMII